MDKHKPEAPKDYARKSSLLENNDWEYQNKESYPTLARYFVYILAAGAVAFMVGMAVREWIA